MAPLKTPLYTPGTGVPIDLGMKREAGANPAQDPVRTRCEPGANPVRTRRRTRCEPGANPAQDPVRTRRRTAAVFGKNALRPTASITWEGASVDMSRKSEDLPVS